jgi:hypothetical protein
VIVAHDKDMHERRTETRPRTELIGHFTREAILRDDFAAIEEFITHWGEEHPEAAELKAVTPNGFVLVHFKGSARAGHPVPFRIKVEHNQRELLTLEMVKDLSSVEESLSRFIMRLIWGSVFLIVILGGSFGIR